MKLIKIINEVITNFYKEGVGDEYLKRKYGMKTDDDRFEKQYATQNKNGFYRDKDWVLLKNPSSSDEFNNGARGVIVPNGDLYIEGYGGERIHNDILKILAQKNVLGSIPRKNWTRKLPNEAGFLTVQQYKNSPYIAIGESNRLIYDQDDYNKYIDEYDRFINRAQSKNPNLKFINKLVGTKYLKKSHSSNTMNESYLK